MVVNVVNVVVNVVVNGSKCVKQEVPILTFYNDILICECDEFQLHPD